jgi:hypothetical protein
MLFLDLGKLKIALPKLSIYYNTDIWQWQSISRSVGLISI